MTNTEKNKTGRNSKAQARTTRKQRAANKSRRIKMLNNWFVRRRAALGTLNAIPDRIVEPEVGEAHEIGVIERLKARYKKGTNQRELTVGQFERMGLVMKFAKVADREIDTTGLQRIKPIRLTAKKANKIRHASWFYAKSQIVGKNRKNKCRRHRATKYVVKINSYFNDRYPATPEM
jgi:hypothetical protein